MSLKSFHIFFIAVSILFAAGFAYWELSAYGGDNATSELALGVIGVVSCAGLVVYLFRVVKKLKNLKPVG
jgi:hypothetical protein